MTRSIDLTPTWRDILPMLLTAYENGNVNGRKLAFEELARMADIATAAVAEQTATTLTAADIEPARELIFRAESALKGGRLTDGQRRDLLKDNLPELSSHRVHAIVAALSLQVRPDENVGSVEFNPDDLAGYHPDQSEAERQRRGS